LLSASDDQQKFIENMEKLLTDQPLREKMGSWAAHYIRADHDKNSNYKMLSKYLFDLVDSTNNG
jgi:hypothetical protein